jgi:gliding motility-associated-like protein
MRPDLIKHFITAILVFCSCAAIAQIPSSPCSSSGGKRADVLGVDAKYSSPGSSAPVFNIPAGTKSISIYISSETGITSGENDYAKGDEDFITVNATIDIASGTSSGYVNYSKNTFTNGSGTNVYGWKNAPLGSYIPAASKIGDATPDLNNVNFTISGSTLTIMQSFSGIHSSYYVQYLSPYSNSLNLLEPQVKTLLHGTTAANTDLLIPIPDGADIIFLKGKGTNSSNNDLNTTDGTEEGYSNLRFTIDLDNGLTDGFVTLANGGSANRRSTYVVSNMANTYSGQLVGSAAVNGDYNGKSSNAGAVGIFHPRIYVSGSNLVIKRDADYARDFDDAYIVEFYKRTGQGMSAEFVSSRIEFIPTGQSTVHGVSRTFNIPPGTNAIYFNQAGNAVNVSRESNENSLEAYAYIDLTTETASGYFYQQVGLSLDQRRDDNFAFKGVPLNNTGARSHANTVGFKSPFNYDISFSLSADKSQLTVTNKTDLANPFYQILLSADYYGSKPDIAFNASGVTFTKVTDKTVRANVAVCNPGAGNSNGGMPVSFYHGDPTVDPSAKLLYTGTFNEGIDAGQCKNFTFDLDLSSFSNLNIDVTIVINDNGSFVPGGVGHPIGTPFTLTALETQHATYLECYYGNNLITKAINVNNAPEVDPDPDNSSGATGNYSYLNYFNAGSSTGAKIADADLVIIDPDAPNLSAATITLTNTPDAGSEALYLNGTLPSGITISGNGTNIIHLSGQAPQTDYIAALKMIEYRNTNGSPNTTNRIVTTTVNDGVESSPASTTTIVILTDPRMNVTGNGATIADNSTTAAAADGTDFGLMTGGAVTHTFSIGNIGTGTINLTGSPAVGISGDAGFTVTTQPAAGTLTAGGTTDFAVSFNPAGHSVGVHTAVVRIVSNDPDADRADYTFTVAAVVNQLPVVSNNSVSGNEDQTLSFTAAGFSGAYSDADNTPLNKIRINSLPLNGSFSLNGAAITIGQEISSSQLDGITFAPTADWNGSTGFDWTASDGISYATTAAHTTINIAPVNDAPGITLPPSAAVTEGVPAPLKDISFADIDAETGVITVTFSVTDGSLSAVSGNGVVVSGTPSSLVLTGTLADINTFIAGRHLTYSTDQNPPASLTIVVHISDNGNTGAGGALEDTEHLLLGITAVNDIPAGNGDARTTNEDTPVSGAVTGTDPDNDALSYTKASDPSHGTVVVNTDGTYTYTPETHYNGQDQFTITISDGNGGSVVVSVAITVTPLNDAPTGTGDTKTTAENNPVNGAVSGTDPDGDALTYTKASDPAHGTVVVNLDGTYTYTPNTNYNGADNFTITFNDGNGGTATVPVAITVTPVNEAPVGTGDSRTTPENTAVSGAVTGTDGDGDAIAYTKATDPANGTVVVNGNGSYTYTPNTNYNGPDNFTISLNDGNGGTVTVPVSITVTPVNEAPVGTGDNKTTPENTAVSGAVTGTDGDGDAIAYTKATAPAHGTVVVNGNGSYTYTPNTDYNGPDIFTITLSDGNGGTVSVPVAITVTPVNEAPVGTGDNKTTPENTAVSGAVTGTDGDGDAIAYTKASDPAHGTVVVNLDGTYTYTPNTNYNGADNFTITFNDGNGGTATVPVVITVTPVNEAPVGTGDNKTTPENTAVSGAVSGTDGDGDAIAYTKATDPAHGTVVVNGNGSYTYTPNTNYNGPDNFTISLNDGNGGTATVPVVITVTPVNEAPVGTGDNKTTPENTPVSGAVTGTDGDGDAIAYTKATDPANGTVVVNGNGSYTYTPNANYNGPDNFTISLNDGNGGIVTVPVTITVTPVNEMPVGVDDAKTTAENTPVSGTITGTDGDGDVLSYTKATDPAHGTVVVNANASYTYTPNTDYNGPDVFTVDISDGNGGNALVRVTITVTPVNAIPVGSGDAKTTPENTSVSGAVTGTDGDGDAIAYTKATDPAHGAVVVNINGSYTYTPDTDYNGPDNFTITLSDGNGGTATVPVAITVTPVNEAPIGTGDNKTTPENTPVSGAVTGTDGDGDAMAYTKATDPAHGTVVVNGNGSYTYTPNANYSGPDNFTISLSDGNGGTATVPVTITVTPVNKIPVGVDDAKTTAENTPVSGVITATDGDGDVLSYTKATDPAHGTVVVNANGSYTYTPNTDYNGPDVFTVDISDGNGGNALARVTITVTPVNAIPVGSGDAKTTPENTAVNGAVTGADGDGDAIAYTKATDPAHGTVVVNADGTYRYTPNTNYNGADNFTITLNDGNGGTVTVPVTITVTPVNIAPVATDDNKTTPENTPVSGAVTGTDGDGDALTFNKATDPAHGTVVVNANGAYTYTPNTNYNGADNFTVNISDGNGGTALAKVMITVTPVNEIPTGTGDARTTDENTPVRGAVTGTDRDGDVLTFTKAANPSQGIAVVNADGTYTYTPNPNYSGPDNFTVAISDGKGGTTIVTVNITVIPADVIAGIALVKAGILRSDNISITYAFTVTNTGKATLYNITVTDPMLGLNKTLTTNLQPGASANITAVYRLTQEDRNKGVVTNTATVKGQTIKNIEVTDISGTRLDNDNPTKNLVPASPEAFDDEADTKVNTPVAVPVLNNDNPAQSSFNTESVTVIRQPLRGKAVVNLAGTVSYIPDSDFSGDDNFTYQVRDKEGYLTNVATVVLHVQPGDIKIPTLFTPNADGKNDVFEVRGLQAYAENELVIINRWGNEVYRQKNYQNNWRGDGLNEGTYYYILRIRKTNGSNWEVLKGYTTLIRKFKQ